ncbi:hypothetical protein LOAG_13300 [Loa loa]|uniref:Uncharacterized protein n=1 Tax=Loa loa TaxID=7209 RepID=A0A1S0TK49_LOALO|nr:hypothetical protein LOAG_13300 [Loa loa]EFO15211.1 hypothetical protein LOAG_13300 [Loa loa]
MQSAATTTFILIGIIKQDFGIFVDIHKWQFHLSINLSTYQINDWECLERVKRCFLNAQLSKPFMPSMLTVSTNNIDIYVGLNCTVQQTFLDRMYQIEILAYNCSKRRLKRSIKSNLIETYQNYEPIGGFEINATRKIVYFIAILVITGYLITLYLIFCIILARHANSLSSFQCGMCCKD